MTIRYVEGFEHQEESITGAFDSTHGLWTFTAGGSQITFPSGRTGQSAKFIYDGITDRRLVAVDINTVLDHFTGCMYFRIPSAPSVQSSMFSCASSGGASVMTDVRITTGGVIQLAVNTGATYQTGPNVADNNWHRLDWHLDSSTTTWTIQWKVDGSAQTNATATGVAGTDCVRIVYGSSTTAHTLTVEFDDVVIGDAASDYPFNSGADYNVGFLVPSADGTHVAGTNVIEDQAGTDIVSPNAFPLINEVPLEQTDYIRQNATGVSNYAEVTFNSTTHDTILAASGLVFGGTAAGGSANATFRFTDSGGTTLEDIYSGSFDAATRGGMRRIPDPGGDGWTQSELNGIRFRFGFSTNASAGTIIPRCFLALVQYAYGADVGGGTGVIDPMGMSGFFGG